MTNNRFLFTAGQRLRGLRELMGLKRPAFAQITGISKKRLENIENGLQKMHDEDFEKVCSLYPQFSRWMAYGGPVDREAMDLKVADSAQMAAVYLVQRNPALLEGSGLSLDDWSERHQPQLLLLSESEARHKELLEKQRLEREAQAEQDFIEGESHKVEDEDE